MIKKIFKLSLTDLDTIKQDLERLEEINKVWNDNEPMESVDINGKHLQELYDYINKLEKENEQLKQQRDSLAINNGELCVKVCKLEKENQELKQDVKDVLEDYKDAALKMFKYAEVIEILKKLKINIYEGWGTWCIKIDDWSEIEEEQATLLKEVLE